jgi:energy-converting hydrogenase Eha subunit E
MESSFIKIKSQASNAPIGALIGGVVGYSIARNLKYDHTLSVISFIVVGTILGATIALKTKTI